ncbi:hypothetical protein GFS24_11560 [Chitinophaga sp. SYP-B3965]|uniref:DUF6660 family protein n=1 Tax=Chitinophaga sp. SYP-B3965 TaxID=2663120 RepID=UPI001299D228|nr:DUF6660 family protein [Chitinophaga sp. SYP-B3965]MRG45755.1 hypothetical protein [Chitinophaga sp. SYP-B3965]
MRMLTYILTILVLTLSCLPCADADVAHNDMESMSMTHPAQDQHPDACSPFCICTCCASYSFIYYTATNLTVPVSSPNYSFFDVHTLHEISLPIWQPPQLV